MVIRDGSVGLPENDVNITGKNDSGAGCGYRISCGEKVEQKYNIHFINRLFFSSPKDY